jgi:hypothetical protein
MSWTAVEIQRFGARTGMAGDGRAAVEVPETRGSIDWLQYDFDRSERRTGWCFHVLRQ